MGPRLVVAARPTRAAQAGIVAAAEALRRRDRDDERRAVREAPNRVARGRRSEKSERAPDATTDRGSGGALLMTPAELRALVDEATPGPSLYRPDDPGTLPCAKHGDNPELWICSNCLDELK